MKQIQHNSFGNNQTDIELVNFLNTLRDSPREIPKIQRQVMKFMHNVNATGFYLRIILSKMQHNLYHQPFKSLAVNMLDMMKKDLLTRVQKHKWRSAVKCKVVACVNEQFRGIYRMYKRSSQPPVIPKITPIT